MVSIDSSASSTADSVNGTISELVMVDQKDRMKKARTGVPGLDDVLSGGLAPGHVFLLEGEPGTGKTTIALRFLLEGAEAGEKCLYVTLSETEQELRDGAASHGWTIGESIEVFELAPAESQLDADQQQTLLYSSDLELGEATSRIFEAALQKTNACSEALFRTTRRDSVAARRPNVRIQ
jgi:KaiC/GvpD/RAD55 family RecA-like ATPase